MRLGSQSSNFLLLCRDQIMKLVSSGHNSGHTFNAMADRCFAEKCPAVREILCILCLLYICTDLRP